MRTIYQHETETAHGRHLDMEVNLGSPVAWLNVDLPTGGSTSVALTLAEIGDLIVSLAFARSLVVPLD